MGSEQVSMRSLLSDPFVLTVLAHSSRSIHRFGHEMAM